MGFSPDETDSPLIVNAYRMLPLPFAVQRLKVVAGRHTKVVEARCVVNETQLS